MAGCAHKQPFGLKLIRIQRLALCTVKGILSPGVAHAAVAWASLPTLLNLLADAQGTWPVTGDVMASAWVKTIHESGPSFTVHYYKRNGLTLLFSHMPTGSL